uniref:Aspergillus nuclease S(1) n=1 Tax=Spongospora subterranea TaxID=70186 RepID=A0A0H5R3S9_9EUKA|eukprot:CRZ08850.1 hypothetical protein [Spongospora subterranea]
MLRALLVAFIACFVNIDAWGKEGHEIVAAIAQSLLTDKANGICATLLAHDGGTLESIASWADEIRRFAQYRWTEPLHFVDTPEWACKFVDSDCDAKGCVVSAIHNYTTRLRTPFHGSESTIDLKFLTHFAGDIHQPLHVSFTQDRGGNSEHGHFCGTKTNLHKIWDTDMIHRRMRNDFDESQQQYTEFLIKEAGKKSFEQVNLWVGNHIMESGQIEAWASETASLACEFAYKDRNGTLIMSGFDICQEYYQRSIPVVEAQLIKGGVRLAFLLNTISETPVVIHPEAPMLS